MKTRIQAGLSYKISCLVCMVSYWPCDVTLSHSEHFLFKNRSNLITLIGFKLKICNQKKRRLCFWYFGTEVGLYFYKNSCNEKTRKTEEKGNSILLSSTIGKTSAFYHQIYRATIFCYEYNEYQCAN